MEHLTKNIDLKTTKSFYSVPTAKSGIFTTFAQTNKESQIKKSCIEHLPGSYYKVNLGDKLDFVVVFQAIQIERLSVEVQNLRVLLKDAQRQIATYLNYEVQIKELTESYHQLEEQLKNYQCELQKMSLACNALYQENSQNKRAFQKEQNDSNSIISGLQKQNNQLKKDIRELQQNMSEIVEGDREHQRKNKLISQELVRLNENLLLGQNELGELRESYAKKSKELQKCIEEIRKWQECARQEKERSNKIEQGTRKNQENQEKIQQELSTINSDRQRLQQQVKNVDKNLKQAEKELINRGQQLQQLKSGLGQKQQELNQLKNIFQNEKKNNQSMKREFDNFGRQTERMRKQINEKDAANKELNHYLSQLKTELVTSKNQAEQLNRYISELQNRIEQGMNQIKKIKQLLQTYNSEIANGKAREKQLMNKITNFGSVLEQNTQLNNEIVQLSTKLGEKDDLIFSKEQQINDITIQNKELFRNNESLEANLQNIAQTIKQLQNTLNRERQTFQSQKSKLTQEFQKLIDREKDDKNKLERQLVKVREEGLVSESTKMEVAALKNACQKQAQQIQNLKMLLQNMSRVLQKLKQKNKEHKEIERANENLKKQLSASIHMNQQLVERMGNQLAQISSLMEQIYVLEEKLRKEKDKNDDFLSYSTEKTIISTVPSKDPIKQTKVEAPAYNFAGNYNSQERYSAPQPQQFNVYNGPPTDRNFTEKSFSAYQTSNLGSNLGSNIGTNGKKYTLIGKLDFNSNSNNLTKSVMVNDGVLFESRKVLEPSTSFPSRESKGQPYKGSLSFRESASSAYQQFKRERKI